LFGMQEVEEGVYELLARMQLQRCAASGPSACGGGHVAFALRRGPAAGQLAVVWAAAHLSNIASTIWPAAFALADALLTLRGESAYEHAFRGRRMLELGAGTGVTGLLLALHDHWQARDEPRGSHVARPEPERDDQCCGDGGGTQYLLTDADESAVQRIRENALLTLCDPATATHCVVHPDGSGVARGDGDATLDGHEGRWRRARYETVSSYGTGPMSTSDASTLSDAMSAGASAASPGRGCCCASCACDHVDLDAGGEGEGGQLHAKPNACCGGATACPATVIAAETLDWIDVAEARDDAIRRRCAARGVAAPAVLNFMPATDADVPCGDDASNPAWRPCDLPPRLQQLRAGYRLVVGADLVYAPEVVPALAVTLEVLLAPGPDDCGGGGATAGRSVEVADTGAHVAAVGLTPAVVALRAIAGAGPACRVGLLASTRRNPATYDGLLRELAAASLVYVDITAAVDELLAAGGGPWVETLAELLAGGSAPGGSWTDRGPPPAHQNAASSGEVRLALVLHAATAQELRLAAAQ
jgi:hypothetical protein